ncbi:hypothetical protein ICV01_07310 [Polynucleobacter sp. MWH-Spelu-300-X4]|uniref:hypothetical protein n=1 Tax=Polynucleobacter sp. MWH-Spelu-300-X4 TaxID=2689109 RepID=UPI001BFD4046|nr:hypothetical protein [Polynucleobacter sp. MWH-Spelu-300-X4]QWD79442.1 hypothetical protein ICV01_07310 [Polynucleobacter sp. MWH-Spelu-300-X4]
MAIQLATLNIQFIEGDDTNDTILAMEKILECAANDADVEDVQISYVEKDRVISVGIFFDSDSRLSFLEAGIALGNCKKECMDSDLVRCLSFWNSVNAIDGTTIASPI